uniref:Protein phosphatase methylesterase 1 n=1 Tax=Globodera rostochiensis TaxID=31243 RepID=A0A914H0D9_GLORO
MNDFSPLNWNDFFDKMESVQVDDDVFNVYVKGSRGPLFLLLHGGGYTGLSWAVLSEQLSSSIECQILAPDLRGHGETKTKDDNNLSAENQISDVQNIYWHFYGREQQKHPPTILIGHSMGGAIAIRTAASGNIPNVLVFLRNRPQQFSSVERAVEWCVKSRTTSNLRAAKISMPCRLKKSNSSKGEVFQWRTNLTRTEPHWHGWFKGLSKLFLQCEPVKVLILANVDRLDRELLTGQMRGQFQLEVLPKAGHAVHEDSPELVAKIFVSLLICEKQMLDADDDKLLSAVGACPKFDNQEKDESDQNGQSKGEEAQFLLKG